MASFLAIAQSYLPVLFLTLTSFSLFTFIISLIRLATIACSGSSGDFLFFAFSYSYSLLWRDICNPFIIFLLSVISTSYGLSFWQLSLIFFLQLKYQLYFSSLSCLSWLNIFLRVFLASKKWGCSPLMRISMSLGSVELILLQSDMHWASFLCKVW